MDHSIAPQTCVFKLNCPKCQKKVKKLLSRLNGVCSIKIEGGAGRVTVKSTLHPNKLFAVMGEAMKEQEYSCEAQTIPPPNYEGSNNMRVAPGNGYSEFKGYEIADLQELANTKKLKHLEFTQTRNLRMTFSEEKDDGPFQNGSDIGPPSEPKQAEDPNAFLQEPEAVAGPSHRGVCPPSCAASPSECEVRNSPHCAECVVTYRHSGPYYTPPPLYYHHALLPYHGYPYPYLPPPYHSSTAAVPPPSPPPSQPPPPRKANNVDLSCDSASKCRLM